MRIGTQRFLKYFYVNIDEAVYKCESTACLYPFRNFKYKNYVDRTIFRYERITETGESNLDSNHKILTSPTKIENDDIDEFNLNWLDNSLADELDSILTTPSEGENCDIKEIINNICSNENTKSVTFSSPSGTGNEQSSKAPAAKLSKCFQLIEHLSPTNLTPANKVVAMASTGRIDAHTFTSKESILSNRVLKHSSKHRNRLKKIRETKPVESLIVKRRPLDWLNTVNKMEPKQMHEFEFASPAQLSELNSYTQPVLIEMIGVPPSNSSQSNQLRNKGESCLLYELDASELQPIKCQGETMSNVQLENSVTQTWSDQILVGTSNVDHSSFVSGENFSANSQIIETKVEAGSFRSKKDHTVINVVKFGEHLVRKNEKKKHQRFSTITRKTKLMKLNSIRRNFNIECEENFHGFATLEPYQPMVLRRKPLVWLKIV